MGPEARTETAATRLVWAVGYFTDEDYFVPFLRVKNLPAKLHRGAKLVGAGGSVHDARLERKSEKKIGNWRWRENPFSGTRELDGLRVMMALLNNFDLKDDNNAIYNSPCDGDSACPMHIYVMADLGATFGATHQIWPHHARRGDLDTYSRSTFIRKVTPDYVNFGAPSRPLLFNGYLGPLSCSP